MFTRGSSLAVVFCPSLFLCCVVAFHSPFRPLYFEWQNRNSIARTAEHKPQNQKRSRLELKRANSFSDDALHKESGGGGGFFSEQDGELTYLTPSRFARRIIDDDDPSMGRQLDSQTQGGSFDWITRLRNRDVKYGGLQQRWAPLVKGSRLAQMCARPAPHALPTLKALMEEHEGCMDQAKNDVLEFMRTQKECSEIDAQYYGMLEEFVKHFLDAAQLSKTVPPERLKQLGIDLIAFVSKKQEFAFSPYHKAVRGPFDHYRFGNELFGALVDLKNSKIDGESELNMIEQELERGDNVMFLSNHQVEPDPQVLSIIFNSMGFTNLAEQIIMVAGHRVRDDPLSIPFSMGRNLICIHSKKHMEHPADQKAQKQRENLDAMSAMQGLMKEGGKLFWVAPSGGRDRPNSSGKFEVAPFDPKAVSLFNVMGKKSKRPLHFRPMALFTYPICPPPAQVKKELGESRSCAFSPVGMAIGREVSVEEDMAEMAHRYVRKAYTSINPLKKQV